MAQFGPRRSGAVERAYLRLGQKLATALTGYHNASSLSHRLHARRMGPLLGMIEVVHAAHGRVRLLDVGGVEAYWDVLPPGFLDRYGVAITVVNLPGTHMPADHGRFTFVPADGCRLDMFRDGVFDIAHANSVIEHVGDWERMVAFAGEVARVAPRYFVQTPNYCFPIEPHFMAPFFHWLPRSARVWLFHHVGAGFWHRRATEEEAAAVVDSIHLLRRQELQALFKDAAIVTERFLGLSKSLIAIKG